MKKQQKLMVILRGVPGAGKSTYIKEVLKALEDVVCSADHYFMRGGKYRFYPSDIGKAHEASQRKAFNLCRSGAPLVIIDNTNTQKWEFEPYLQMAKERSYDVQVVRLTAPTDMVFARNIHGVPLKNVEKMVGRFEDFEGETVLQSLDGQFTPISDAEAA